MILIGSRPIETCMGLIKECAACGAGIILVLMLSGCLNSDPRVRDVDQSNEIPEISIPDHKDDFEKVGSKLSKLENELLSSNNQTQNAITGVGANLGKVSDKLTGIESDISASFEARAELKANLLSDISEVKIELSNSMKALSENQIKMKSEIESSIRADLNAIAAAQAGIGNKIERNTEMLSQSSKAGRDAFQIHQNLSKESVEALRSSNRTIFWTTIGSLGMCLAMVVICASVVVAFLERSRKRAELRAKGEAK